MDLTNARALWTLFSFAVYFLLFGGAVFGIALWRVKRRRNRPPVDFKFLRGPGETLRRRMAQFDEDFFLRFVLAALAPVLAAIVVSYGVLKYRPQTVTHLWIGSGLVILAFFGTLIPMVRWGVQSLIRYHNDRLGYHVVESMLIDNLPPPLSSEYSKIGFERNLIRGAFCIKAFCGLAYRLEPGVACK
jgi:hypothetical protein